MFVEIDLIFKVNFLNARNLTKKDIAESLTPDLKKRTY